MPRQLFVDLRERDVGGAVTPAMAFAGESGTNYVAQPPASLQSLAALRDPTVVLVHGYNVNRPDGIKVLRSAMDLVIKRFPGAGLLMAVLWPGDSFVGALGYPSEADDADDSGAELAKFIETWLSRQMPLHFVTHSLGARVALVAANRLLRNRPAWPLGRFCLMAAAVDRGCLVDADAKRGYAAVTRACDRIGVLSSTQDAVLGLAYPLGDLGMYLGFSDTDRPGLALGSRGPWLPATVDPLLKSHIEHWPIDATLKIGHSMYMPPPGAVPDDDQARGCRAAADFLSGRALEFPPTNRA